MLIKYYFKIQYTKGTKNVRVDTLSRKAKLQNNKKLLGVILRRDNNGLIKYNYLKLVITQEDRERKRVYKTLESFQV